MYYENLIDLSKISDPCINKSLFTFIERISVILLKYNKKYD